MPTVTGTNSSLAVADHEHALDLRLLASGAVAATVLPPCSVRNRLPSASRTVTEMIGTESARAPRGDDLGRRGEVRPQPSGGCRA
jgi:hypothetical protein